LPSNYFRKCNHGRELFSCSRLQFDFEAEGENGAESVLKYILMLKELVLVVCNVVKGNVFQGPRNYRNLFTSGFSFNIPTPKIVNALKQEIIKAVAFRF
jgi:hypothetical protein